MKNGSPSWKVSQSRTETNGDSGVCGFHAGWPQRLELTTLMVRRSDCGSSHSDDDRQGLLDRNDLTDSLMGSVSDGMDFLTRGKME